MNAAELICNPDGSIYHLNLLPGDIASTIILVGDPERVKEVSKHFDTIQTIKQRREFLTHTGSLGGKKISVISTGIGTDNIDIVLNELDALVNIDFSKKEVKPTLQQLNLIRIGTSGAIHPDIHPGQIVVSAMAAGTDTLGAFYTSETSHLSLLPPWTYLARRYSFDLGKFSLPFIEGITLTSPGFYGPQQRRLRLTPSYPIDLDELYQTSIEDFSFTNLEMETSGIYLLSSLLEHRAISFNAILANRLHGTFSDHPQIVVDTLIKATLAWIQTIEQV